MKPTKISLALLTVASLQTALAQTSPVSMTDNPLLQAYPTPHQTAPYGKIKTEHFLPALKENMAKGRGEIDALLKQRSAPTFDNTIVALERAGDGVGKVSSVLFHLNAAETTPELQQVVKEASPLLTEYGNDITLNAQLFQRVKAVWDQRGKLKLGPEDNMLLEKTYKGFTRNGANLSATDKDKLRAINKELSQLSISFNEHTLAETNAYALELTEADLTGLPEFVREGAKAAAKRLGKPGYVITLQAPSYGPFMQYADRRDLREKVFRAFAGRGFQSDAYDNQAVIEKMVKLRHEKAQLLGYKTWADFTLEERMAKNPAKVAEFLDGLLGHAKPAAERELAELTAYARSQGFKEDKLQRWDVSYYAEKLKQEKYAIGDEQLKPYFKLENVLDGIFQTAQKLYGLTFKENKAIPVWNLEVKAYEVFDADGKFLAVWYGDYFPRPGKRAGAWNNSLVSQHFAGKAEVRPHVVNVCNFSRPTDTKPSLLTFREVETLFHEFGHALHSMLAQGKYESLTGTSVSWDFVELPSQIMENFAIEPEVLRLFARHYQTNEVIPNAYITKLKASSNFLAGMNTLRQVGLGLIDMAWHGQAPTGESVLETEAKVNARTDLYPVVPGVATSPAFAHIFAGGYSAGYYSYQWSAVLDADAFEAFKEKGVFNPQVAKSFRENILSKGGSEKPDVLYRRFRGRDPQPDAMLRRAGLVQ